MTTVSAPEKAYKLLIDGIVQGVGFRPFVYRLAWELSLKGWVANCNGGVLVHLQGEAEAVDRFIELLPLRAPDAAFISCIERKSVAPGNYDRFLIKDSRRFPGNSTGISPDIAVCQECLADMKNQQHRLSYPLVNCTNCGPRFSIISGLPYDRVSTSMKKFVMCSVCEKEYHDPYNRRFHAQPVACNNCGPFYNIEIYRENIKTDGGRPIDPHPFSTGGNIDTLCHLLENGGVVTLKGTGGYNLICDAADHDAVERIREIKGRESKPFAVMFRDIEKIKACCSADTKEMEILQSWRRPVVILKHAENNGSRKSELHAYSGGSLSGFKDTISPGVSGGLNTVGAILPYMPFHYLLFEKLKIHALVFTSANISENPIVAEDQSARSFFAGKTDAFVSYNREIINPVDDSVCSLAGGNIQIIRRSRGYVPEGVNMPFRCESIFAAGSDLKNAFAIGKGSRAILSQHNGDMEHYETFLRYRSTVDSFSSLFNFSPCHIVCDLHPDYHSARFASQLAEETGSSLLRVQHHHAHIASCMAEKGIDEPVIGVCFDGTGFGDDGNVWGSEFMICDYLSYERYSHFTYIPLPGGDAAIKEPWRIALSCLRMLNHRETDQWIGKILHDLPWEKIEIVDKMVAGRINSPLSCGAGRLFDAVAALTGICREAGYDGEAPMRLENICSPQVKDGYEFSTDSLAVIDQVMADIKRKVSPRIIASRFHNGMALFIHDTVGLMSKKTGLEKVMLSGGVFQNAYLLNRVVELLRQNRMQVFTNLLVPVNDGGLALGQLAIAAKKTEKSCA